MSKIHLKDPADKEFDIAICGKYGGLKLVNDSDDVTCQRCLQVIESRLKRGLLEVVEKSWWQRLFGL